MTENEQGYLTEVANGINDVLNMCGMVTMSWGISDRRAVMFMGRPSLRFRVNGFVHKGDVVVSLNEGQDLYEIYLLTGDSMVGKCFKEVYVEDLVGILDREVETGDSTEEEYRAKVSQWLEQTSAQQCQGM